MTEKTGEEESIFKPLIFKKGLENDLSRFRQLLESGKVWSVHDQIEGQLRELIKGRHPSRILTDSDYHSLIVEHLNGCSPEDYGVWVYYPWSGRLVHLLNEEEYAEVRTNRNKYKITREEEAVLRTKIVGIMGLSVGQSIALTLAMERTFGEIRLADFDVLELSNMNRIRSGAHNLGVSKVVLAAREIAEIDPFLKVTLFENGITEQSIDSFFTTGGKLDVLIEECDSLDVKILARHKARELRIPVIMDTSDRGLIDVERFDLEPERLLLHGLVGDISPDTVRGLSNEQKIPYVLKIIDVDKISERLRQSMGEVSKTINTWPQLASGVVMGGAIAADVCRRVLLNQFTDSGRYYMDPEEQIANK